MTDEEMKLLDSLSISWEFPKNKDFPIVLLTYKDIDGKLFVLRGSYADEGVMNVGEEYRKCFNELDKYKKGATD